MSHEFKVHHLVSELVSYLHVHEVTGVDSHVELLLKHRSPYVTTQVSAATARRKISEFSSKGDEFTRKYEELQPRQLRDLNPLIYLLSKIADDERLCAFLQERCPPEPPLTRREADISILDEIDAGELKALPAKGAVLSKEELGSLMGRLETVTSVLQERERAKLKSSSIEGNFPELPAWLFERTYLTADFVPPFAARPQPSAPLPLSLAAMPQQLQQQAVLEDLLFVMLGVDGRYIRAEPREDGLMVRKFAVDKALDVSLRTLVDRILPVCGCYSVVSKFVEDKSRFVQGMVNQALCAAMRGLLKEYRVVVAQLEHQFHLNQLSLQKLWYYVQPCMATLEVLVQVATAVTQGSCRGGKTMTTLHAITLGYIGEDRAQQLCVHLSQAACQPYFKSLEKWIYQGIIHDPYSEFMIEEHESIQKSRLHEEYNDAYWERRYTVQQESIPSFLEHIADKILRTGKYLNVVRECGQEVAYPAAQHLQYSIHERHLIEQIEEAYSYASRKLLDLIMVEQDLRGYLLSIKHYFLLDQGDLFVHFMDMAGEELARPMADILPSRLESLLELALRTSLADSDPYKDNLRACLVPYDLVTQLLHITAIQPEGVGPDAAPPPPIARPESMPTLSGLESFGLEYIVKFPLALVISYRSLYKYQLLFRHLFYCKHVERQLCATWRSHRTSMGTRLQPNTWHTSAFALLQRMLNFVQSLQYYMTMEVLEPNWTAFERTLHSVTTIDDVLMSHNDFLDNSLRDCLLSDRNILKTVSRLMELCLYFCQHMQLEVGEAGHLPAQDDQSESGRRAKRVISVDLDTLVSRESFQQTISQTEGQFTRDLLALQDTLLGLHADTLSNMVSRLDYNGFYHNMRHS